MLGHINQKVFRTFFGSAINAHNVIHACIVGRIYAGACGRGAGLQVAMVVTIGSVARLAYDCQRIAAAHFLTCRHQQF